MEHPTNTPVTVLEWEPRDDGTQRFSFGVHLAEGAQQVVHLFGRMELEAVEEHSDSPLAYKLVFRMGAPTAGQPRMVLGEIRISAPPQRTDEELDS